MFLSDRHVVILPDNDKAGREHAVMVERFCKSYAKSVCILQLPGLGDKEDVSNWIGRGGTTAQLIELYEQTKKKPDAKKFLYVAPRRFGTFSPSLYAAVSIDCLSAIAGIQEYQG